MHHQHSRPCGLVVHANEIVFGDQTFNVFRFPIINTLEVWFFVCLSGGRP